MDLLGRLCDHQYNYGLTFFIGLIGKVSPIYNALYDFDEAFPMDLIAGAFSSRLLLIFLVIFPPVLISVWLIHHPCRDIVTNRATGSFGIMANTLTQLEIYYLPLILSSQARLVQAFDSLTVQS